jgi:iron-sulfur cluster insertion protein
MNAVEMGPLLFTDAAASKVKSLIEEEGNPELKRVFAAAAVASTVSRSMSSTKTTR